MRGATRVTLCAGLVLAVLLRAPPVDAASALRTCKKSCKVALGACSRASRSERTTSRKACASAADAKNCRRDVQRIARASRGVCRNARGRCRTCCTAGRAGCDRAPELPRFTGDFPKPDRRGLEQTPLPPGPNGRGFMLLQLPDGAFFFDPAARSPVSAAAECATVMLACFHPMQRNWSGCFTSVPTCPTDTPWVGDDPMCCPSACAERYQELRAAGRPDPEAFAAAIWEVPSCMPGIAGHVREARP